MTRLFARMVAVGLVACTWGIGAQEPASRVADIQTLAEGVYLLPGRFERGRQPDGNSLLLDGRDGLVVIDTGRHAEHTAALLEFAQQRARPLQAVINTHWHLDHLGGNAMLRRALPQLQVYASAAVDRAIATTMERSRTDMQAMLVDPQTDETTRTMVRIDLALLSERAMLAPDRRIDGPPAEQDIAGRTLLLGVEPDAVSGGDVWVLDRASGTLAVGDFVTLPVPFFDTACAPRWRDAMARLEALPFERVVPGHGPVLSRADFGRYRGALERLLDCASGQRPVAECSAGWIADLGEFLPEREHRSAHGMFAHYLNQHLRAAPGARDRFCPAEAPVTK